MKTWPQIFRSAHEYKLYENHMRVSRFIHYARCDTVRYLVGVERFVRYSVTVHG